MAARDRSLSGQSKGGPAFLLPRARLFGFLPWPRRLAASLLHARTFLFSTPSFSNIIREHAKQADMRKLARRPLISRG